MDPFTIMAGASAAYNAIKQGIAFGKELHDMGSQLSAWGSAISDMDFMQSQAENPPWYKFGNTGLDAAEIFANKKKLEAQRYDLKQFISLSYGPKGWEEYLRIEAQVRKQKRDTEYRKAEFKQSVITFVLSTLIVLVGVTLLVGVIYGLGVQQGKW